MVNGNFTPNLLVSSLQKQSKALETISNHLNLTEIKRSRTSDLMSVQKSITSYLKAMKTKKQVKNLFPTLKLIATELRERSMEYQDLSTKSASETKSICSEDKLLGRKSSPKLSIHEIEIPSFFNDKAKKEVVKVKVVEELEKPSFRDAYFKSKVLANVGFQNEYIVDLDLSGDCDYRAQCGISSVELREFELANVIFEPLDDLFTLE
jgi:hypothetical protein